MEIAVFFHYFLRGLKPIFYLHDDVLVFFSFENRSPVVSRETLNDTSFIRYITCARATSFLDGGHLVRLES